MSLNNPVAERMVLAGICKYGAEAYYDAIDIVTDSSFTIESNINIYNCLKSILEHDDSVNIDIGSIQSAANNIGLASFFSNNNELQHLNAILKFDVELSNVRKSAIIIRKLEIAKQLRGKLDEAQQKLFEVNGNEKISDIIDVAESTIFNFTSSLDNTDKLPTTIGSNIIEHFDYLANNPVEQIGISTGFPRYDSLIGGGLRNGTVNVIGARPKCGKSIFAAIACLNIARYNNIPTIHLDTEMLKEDHQHRMVAALSEVSLNKIETGKYAQNPYDKQKVDEALQIIKDLPYYHEQIGGMRIEEQLTIIRRWLLRNVGLRPDGTANPCVLVYDYLKLMNANDISNNMQEYQSLGFLMSTLHDFTVRYNIPMLALMQLNRDGITKESTDVASGSDRIIWLCSNFTIFKEKSPEEIAKDGVENGNRKLVPIVARHGASSLNDGDYINCKLTGWCTKLEEMKMASELEHDTNGFSTNDAEQQQF